MMSPYHLPEWNALLSTVTQNPADDVARLVAADWLDENGDPPRAELIRIQVELARLAPSSTPGTLQYSRLLWRERNLLLDPTGGLLWGQESCPNLIKIEFQNSGRHFQGLHFYGMERVRFRRGFPHRVLCSASDWLAHGARSVPRQPIVQLVLMKCEELSWEHWETMFPTLSCVRSVWMAARYQQLVTWLQLRLPEVEFRTG